MRSWYFGWFTLLGESLLLGLLVFAAALPLVTAFPAVVAGCALLRSRGEVSVGVRSFAVRLAAAMRPAAVAAPCVVAAVLALDVAAVRAGAPGGRALAVLLPLCGLGAAGLGLRAAAACRPGLAWRAVVRRAAADPGGVLLLSAASTAGLFVAWSVPIVTPLVLGQLVLAAVAIDAR